MKKIIRIVTSFDFVTAFLFFILVTFYNDEYDYDFIKEVVVIFVSIGSFVFGMFMTAVGSLSSSPSDEFILYLERKGGVYFRMMDDFSYVTYLLFINVIILTVAFVFFGVDQYIFLIDHSDLILASIVFFFTYGIGAVASVSLELIFFAKARSRFIVTHSDKSE